MRSWPTTASGSYLSIIPRECRCIQQTCNMVGRNHLPRTRLSKVRSLGAGMILELFCDRALDSNPGGYFPIGLTKVCEEEGCFSGGVTSSILPGEKHFRDQAGTQCALRNSLFSQIRRLAVTISRLLSSWLTTVRTARLMIVSGGVSRGAE